MSFRVVQTALSDPKGATCTPRKPNVALTPDLRMASLLGSLSHALDLVEGQPSGHCVRCCWMGVQIGTQIGLSEAEISELYYTLLLRDLGCSSNAARICQLFLTDDMNFKRDSKTVDTDSLYRAADARA